MNNMNNMNNLNNMNMLNNNESQMMMNKMNMNNTMNMYNMINMNMNMDMNNQMNQMKQMQEEMINIIMKDSQQNSKPDSSSLSSQQGGLNVFFRANSHDGKGKPPLMFKCQLNEKVSDLIQRYREKSGDRDQSKKFIFNAKNLNQSLTIGEAGISNDGNIFVVTTLGIKGAY